MFPDISRQHLNDRNGSHPNGSHRIGGNRIGNHLNGGNHNGGNEDLNPITEIDRRLTSWVNTQPERLLEPHDKFPAFEGQLLTNEEALAQAADDYGHLLHNRPLAVLFPASAQDVVTMIRYARAHSIPVAARGQGHSTFGQSQVKNGIVIDMSSLTSIRSISQTEIEVDAGITWLDLLRTTVAQGLTPPTVPDYLSLSIGGVISVGGLGSQSPLHGAVVDNVLELEIVTGKGELVRCSPQTTVGLFDAVRGGLGQFGIITKARLRLIPAPRMTRLYHLDYDDLPTFLDDMQMLLEEQRFDTMQGFILPRDGGGWRFQLEVNRYLNQDADEFSPNEDALLKKLNFNVDGVSVVEQSYFTGDPNCPGYLDRVEAFVPILQAAELWSAPHPWINVFVPSSKASCLFAKWLESTTPEEVGQGIMMINPYDRMLFSAPFLRVPDSLHFFIFALLRNSTPATEEQNEKLMRLNRQLFEEARAAGGMRYPVDSVVMQPEDWQMHFRSAWELFTMFKQFYDPDRLLSPGQGIFPRSERMTVPTQPILQRLENEFARF